MAVMARQDTAGVMDRLRQLRDTAQAVGGAVRQGLDAAGEGVRRVRRAVDEVSGRPTSTVEVISIERTRSEPPDE